MACDLYVPMVVQWLYSITTNVLIRIFNMHRNFTEAIMLKYFQAKSVVASMRLGLPSMRKGKYTCRHSSM